MYLFIYVFIYLIYLLRRLHVDIGCGQKSFMLVLRCHHFLSGFLAKDHLPRVSRQSLLSANNRYVMQSKFFHFSISI
jgi:hypothetical protein